MAVAVPLDNPHPDIVDVTETEKDPDMSVTTTLVEYMQDVPGLETVTSYDPAESPDTLDPVCPLDQVYVYWSGGLTSMVAAPSDPPQVDGVVVKVTVGLKGAVLICADSTFSQVPPALIVTV